MSPWVHSNSMTTSRAGMNEFRGIPNGAAIAAFLSAMLGLLALALAALLSEASPRISQNIHWLGRVWMPGAAGIGPYSGKETIGLLVWLMTWIVFHLALRKKELDGRRWLILFLVGIGVATTLVWPPVVHFLISALSLKEGI